MRYWFKYNVVWNGSVGELPNVALASMAPFYTNCGTGQYVIGNENTYLGYIDCDSIENANIVINNLSRFSAVLITDQEVCTHIKRIIPIGSTIKDTISNAPKEVTEIKMVNGSPEFTTIDKPGN